MAHSTLLRLGLDLQNKDALLAMMREPHRFYHTVSHVYDIIGDSQDPMIWALAWFHDAVYDPKRQDNEQLSADLGVEMLLHNNVLEIDLTEFRDAILDTASHRAGSSVSQEFSDRDMKVLIRDKAPYAMYRAQIRMEYRHVSWADYRDGRKKVMSSFNDREIFYTPEFRLYEHIAHENIEQEILDLETMDELTFIGESLR